MDEPIRKRVKERFEISVARLTRMLLRENLEDDAYGLLLSTVAAPDHLESCGTPDAGDAVCGFELRRTTPDVANDDDSADCRDGKGENGRSHLVSGPAKHGDHPDHAHRQRDDRGDCPQWLSLLRAIPPSVLLMGCTLPTCGACVERVLHAVRRMRAYA